jgi:addiction module RelE/StbE family toxin
MLSIRLRDWLFENPLPYERVPSGTRRTTAGKHRDHALSGSYAGHRECHITPDWLLIYKIDNDCLILILTRTGTHSDLF